ncbi:hypothetical protein ACIO93_34180 [Streptomyces sp. NPDC087903]|uniref:hypothetical protein n=1 Tax=Streptomyces sp. NPDC087903 TaxID=3365819 RepID=UPI0038184F80
MDLESRLRLERDLPPAEEFLASAGGRLVRREQDPLGVYWAVLQPHNRERVPFTARIAWTVYPNRPPSVHFATEPGGPTTESAAWPAANGYRAPNDICKPFTAEGQGLHAEWAIGQHAWSSTGNPLLFVLDTLQGDIDRVDGRRAA